MLTIVLCTAGITAIMIYSGAIVASMLSEYVYKPKREAKRLKTELTRTKEMLHVANAIVKEQDRIIRLHHYNVA